MPAYDLNGKVALVTGAARGIGFETARQMHMRGASVAVVDLDADEAREAAERIGERAIGIAADVTDAGAMQAAVAETVERFGGLDVAVANAGIAPPKIATTRAMPPEEWERVFEVDLLGVWRTVRAALPQIVERNGHDRHHSSVYAFVNGMINSPYAAAKAGGRGDGPGAAHRADAAGRQRQRRLLRLGRHRDGPGHGRAGRASKRLQEILPRLPARSESRRRGRGGDRRGNRGAGAADLRAGGGWRYVSALRGMLNPLLDRRMERDRQDGRGDPRGRGDWSGRWRCPRVACAA